MTEPLAALDAVARGVLAALLDGTLRGAALALAAAVLLRCAPRLDAASRHAVWWVTLLVVAALPLAGVAAALAPAPAPAGIAAGGAAPGVWSLPAPPAPIPAALLLLLVAAAALRLVAIGRGVTRLRSLKADARPLGGTLAARLRAATGAPLPRSVRLLASRAAPGPLTVGFRRPAILVPAGLLDALTEREALQVALHELAHVRRRDDWTNLAQRLLQAALFFHPAVHWIAGRIALERELACDERVVRWLPGRAGYARCLARVAELAVAGRRAALAPGAATAGGQLATRLRLLLADGAPPPAARPAPAAVASIGVLVLGVALVRAAPALTLTGPAPAAAARAVAAPALPAAPAVPAARLARAPAARGPLAPAVDPAAEARRAEPFVAPRADEAPPATVDERLALIPPPAPAALCPASGCAPEPPALVGPVRIAAAAPPAPPSSARPAEPLRAQGRAARLEVVLSLAGTALGGDPGRAVAAGYPGGPRGPARWSATGSTDGLGRLLARLRPRPSAGGVSVHPRGSLPLRP